MYVDIFFLVTCLLIFSFLGPLAFAFFSSVVGQSEFPPTFARVPPTIINSSSLSRIDINKDLPHCIAIAHIFIDHKQIMLIQINVVINIYSYL